MLWVITSRRTCFLMVSVIKGKISQQILSILPPQCRMHFYRVQTPTTVLIQCKCSLLMNLAADLWSLNSLLQGIMRSSPITQKMTVSQRLFNSGQSDFSSKMVNKYVYLIVGAVFGLTLTGAGVPNPYVWNVDDHMILGSRKFIYQGHRGRTSQS